MAKPTATSVVVSPITFHIGDTIGVSYTYTGDHPESGSLIRWYKNNVYQSGYNDTKSFTVSGARGDTWFYIVIPCDSLQYGDSAQSSVGTMLNNLPTDPTYVEIVPHNPQTNDDLLVVYGGATDPDGDKVLYNIRWYRDGVELVAYRDRVRIPYSELSTDNVFSVEVSTSDGY